MKINFGWFFFGKEKRMETNYGQTFLETKRNRKSFKDENLEKKKDDGNQFWNKSLWKRNNLEINLRKRNKPENQFWIKTLEKKNSGKGKLIYWTLKQSFATCRLLLQIWVSKLFSRLNNVVKYLL